MNECFPCDFMWSFPIFTIYSMLDIDYFLQGKTELTWYGKGIQFFQVEYLSIFLSLLSDVFLCTICFSFYFFPDMWATGALYHERHYAFFPYFWAAYMCVTLWSLLPWAHSPHVVSHKLLLGYCCWIPYLWTSGVGKHVWRRQIGRWWWGQLVKERLICFSLLFFPGHVGLFPLICAFSICRQL